MANERPMKTVVNCETGIQTVEPMTDDEIANWEAVKAESARLQAERDAEIQAKTEARASALAKLAKLGLTEEEAAAIAG